MEQAKILDGLLKEQKVEVGKVVNLHIDDQLLIKRVTGRLIHAASGRTYNTFFSPPKVSVIVISVVISVCVSVCPSAYLSVCLSARVSVCPVERRLLATSRCQLGRIRLPKGFHLPSYLSV